MKQLLHSIFLIILTSGLTPEAFADNTRALDAFLNGDYATAATLWQPLANQGDPVAQYNLGLLYKRGDGINKDKNLSHYWLAMAARRGVAGAYQRISSDAISATNKRVKIIINLSAMDWIANQSPKYYTLQLASSTNENLISKYYRENELTGRAGYYKSLREGEHWYALVYGAYPTVNAAKQAIDNLPGNLKKWSPWVRNIKSIHKLMVR